MFEQDYLVRLMVRFFQGIVKSYERIREHEDPKGAAEMLENAIGEAIEMDSDMLLSLSSDSIAQIMRVSGTDPNVTEFVARSLLLESVYLEQAGDSKLAKLREKQARAIAQEYQFELPEDASDFETITEGLEEAAINGGFDK